MEEIWKQIPELNGKYECSSLGRIRRINKDSRCQKYKILKLQNTQDGYLSVNPVRNYRKRVHRIVAQLFIPNKENYQFVNHKDLNKKNNSVDNLEWVTASMNSKHANDNGRLGRMCWNVIDINGKIYPSIKSVSELMEVNYKWFHRKIKKKGSFAGFTLHEKLYKNIL